MNGSASNPSQGSSLFDGLGQWFSDTADSVANWWEKNSSNVMRGVGAVLVGTVAIGTAVTALPALAAFGTVGTLITAGTLLAGSASTVLGATDLLASGMSAFGNDELLKFTNTNGYLVAEGLAMTGSVLGTAATAPMAAAAQAATGQVAKDAATGTVWDDIDATADNIPGTEIPATFKINVPSNAGYTNPQTQTSVLWTNANATEHMGEYINRPGTLSSTVGIRSQVLLESYSASLNEAVVQSSQSGQIFGTYGNWQLGINFETGTVYHARMLG